MIILLIWALFSRTGSIHSAGSRVREERNHSVATDPPYLKPEISPILTSRRNTLEKHFAVGLQHTFVDIGGRKSPEHESLGVQRVRHGQLQPPSSPKLESSIVLGFRETQEGSCHESTLIQL